MTSISDSIIYERSNFSYRFIFKHLILYFTIAMYTPMNAVYRQCKDSHLLRTRFRCCQFSVSSSYTPFNKKTSLHNLLIEISDTVTHSCTYICTFFPAYHVSTNWYYDPTIIMLWDPAIFFLYYFAKLFGITILQISGKYLYITCKKITFLKPLCHLLSFTSISLFKFSLSKRLCRYQSYFRFAIKYLHLQLFSPT
jgi:hypothetical protein